MVLELLLFPVGPKSRHIGIALTLKAQEESSTVMETTSKETTNYHKNKE